MHPAIIMGLGVAWLLFFYWLMRKILPRAFDVDPSRLTPACTHQDQRDFIPVRHWLILFGHHFASIAGAGPIIGPIIALELWGWLPALLWILVGVVLIGGLHDFGALMLSLRHQGKTISDVTGKVLIPAIRLLFLWFVWFALVLVIAVFTQIAGKAFTEDPRIVVPSLGIIPLAVLLGILMRIRGLPLWISTIVVLAATGLLLVLGPEFPVRAPAWLWFGVLLAYSALASVLPVHYLLQPRDYLSAFFLFGGIGLLVAGILFAPTSLQMPAFQSSTTVQDLQPLFPFLFVTVACGAVSGFHSLIASGTTVRQLPSERYAFRIGYGGMLLEGFLALLVLVVVASLPRAMHQSSHILTFGDALGHLFGGTLPGVRFFAILVLNLFILTTLDTSVRVVRFVTHALFSVRNVWVSTLIPIGVAVLLLLSGQSTAMWQVFGSVNQMMAALALMVVGTWLLQQEQKWVALFAIGGSLWMFSVTLTALVYRIGSTAQIVTQLFALIVFILGCVFVGLWAFWIWKQKSLRFSFRSEKNA